MHAPHFNPSCASRKIIAKPAIMIIPALINICKVGNSLKNTYPIISENNMAVYLNGATTGADAK